MHDEQLAISYNPRDSTPGDTAVRPRQTTAAVLEKRLRAITRSLDNLAIVLDRADPSRPATLEEQRLLRQFDLAFQAARVLREVTKREAGRDFRPAA